MSEDKRNASDSKRGLALEMVPGRFAICRLRPGRVPGWAYRGDFIAIARTHEELSIVCDEKHVPKRVRAEPGWSAMRVAGTLDLSLIGVLASLAMPLAEAKIGLFTVSTFDTDYLLVRSAQLEEAKQVLRDAGHAFNVPRDALAASVGAAPSDAPSDTPSAPKRSEPEHQTRPERQAQPESGDQPEEKPEAEAGDRRDEKPEARSEDRPDQKLETEPDDRAKAETESATETEPETGPETEPETEPVDRDESSDPDRRRAARAKRAEAVAARGPIRREERVDEEVDGSDLATGAIPQDDVETTEETFADLGLSEHVLRALDRIGFKHPTPIQAGVIPEALRETDLVGLAETGSGKTAAFLLPMIERLAEHGGTRGLILCPTREIALQTQAFADLVGKNFKLETVCVIGGVKIGPQIDRLKRGPDIIVATPGRLLDHVERRTVNLDEVEVLVLDEADHMLDLGFLPQIQSVMQALPKTRQTMLFSATMPPPIARLSDRFMNEPVRVDFRPEGRIAAGIEHRLYLVKETDKLACLESLLDELGTSTLVFTRRKIEAEFVARQLENAGYRTTRLHSDRSQAQRVQALRALRTGKTRVLVATDVAARGLDIPRIGHVVNYDLPELVEDYIHRAGRTARGSAAGIVSSVATWKDKITIREIERSIGKKIPRCVAQGVEPYVELRRRKTIRRRLL